MKFDRKQYQNLLTFHRNGNGVKTPARFVQDGDSLFVRTIANSGKVKRIRNKGLFHIASCKVDGALLDDWMEASAGRSATLKLTAKLTACFIKSMAR